MSEIPDYVSVMNLMHIYSEHIDSGNFKEISELFWHADVYMPGDDQPSIPKHTGGFLTSLNEWTRIYNETGTPRTQHLTTNHIINFGDADTASSRSLFVVFQQTEDLPLQPIITGRYHDKFEKASGSWRFAERREFITLKGDLSAHLLQAPPS